MDTIELKVKKPDNYDLPLPSYETKGSSGMDIRAWTDMDIILNPGEIRLVPTGLSISIPDGYEAQIRPRSGLALKYGIGMVNSPGTIDSDYRGEIGIIMINHGDKPFTVRRGDRIAQMVISKVCHAELVMVDDLDSTSRGDGGFGHSGIE
ncbi:MAG: dUTP diphosphatase [Deltaproteobacteria bacterium]|nr:dUTP diphosphatase [Deltaproteobacteria bacterium]